MWYDIIFNKIYTKHEARLQIIPVINTISMHTNAENKLQKLINGSGRTTPYNALNNHFPY